MSAVEIVVLAVVAVVLVAFCWGEIRRQKMYRLRLAEDEARVRKANAELQHRQAVANALRAESDGIMAQGLANVLAQQRNTNPYVRSSSPAVNQNRSRPSRSSSYYDTSPEMNASAWPGPGENVPQASAPSNHSSSYHGSGGTFDGGGASSDWGSSSSSSSDSCSSSSSSSDSGSSCSSSD